MVSLGDLEPEIVSLVLEIVDDTSPKSTKAVACVNKYLNEITRLIAHRHKVIKIPGEVNHAIVDVLNQWASDETILTNIRTLTVDGWVHSEPLADSELSDSELSHDHQSDNENEDEGTDERAQWMPLEVLISRIGKLRLFNWNVRSPLPISILDALEQHQKASELRIFNFVRHLASAQTPDSIEVRLARSTSLTHIRCLCFASFRMSDLHEIAFRSIVASAPGLQYAGLIAEPIFPPNDEVLAALEQIKTNFRMHAKPNPSVKHLTLEGTEISKQTLDDWASIVDLSSLENVKFSRGLPTIDFFQYAATALPNLRNLSLNLRLIHDRIDGPEKKQLIAALQNYVTVCSPLHTLSLWSWTNIVPLRDIIQRHGPTLRTLQLHERETPDRQERETLSLEDIKLIRTSCPALREFTFDLQRSDARLRWENDRNGGYYEELAKFDRLDLVQIYFDSGVSSITNTNIIHDYETDASDIEDENTGETPDDAQAASTHQITANNDIVTLSSSPTTAPPPKRPRLSDEVRPSRDKHMIPYAQRIWTTIFDGKGGARHLDVKFGEWEGSIVPTYIKRLKRYLKVRPNERDDVHEPVVKILQKR